MKRKIIKIDEEKCNGCGNCVPNCREGALKIVGGKARLVSDVFCDGLGACIGHCPQDAITIEEREAEQFDEKKAMENKNSEKPCGCPGSKIMEIKVCEDRAEDKAKQAPQLTNWPVQIKLVPVNAPYFKGADLLIAADCVPFTYPDFHSGMLKGKVLLVGCPKLDDIGFYAGKISEIIKNNPVKSVTYAHMEVPCCFGFIDVIKNAIEASGKKIPFHKIKISIKGEVL